VSDENYASVPLANIREPTEQHRERIDPERLGALADSMASEGLHQPIGLRGPTADGAYEIVWGHRRFLAARTLRWPAIFARIFPESFDPLLARASENLQREQLNPVEEAHIVRLYLDRGAPRAEVARLCRRSLSWVDQRTALLELPADVLDAIRDHGLTLSVARLLADVDHESYRRQLIYDAVAHGATEASAAVWRQHYLADRDRIKSNAVAIETIIQERGKYQLLYPCDWDGTPVPYEATRTWRVCLDCDKQLLEAKAEALDPHQQPAPNGPRAAPTG